MNFTTGSIWRSLMSLSLPAMITIFANLSFVAVDTYFLSRVGLNALTAISFAFPVVALFQMIANALGIAASSIVSRFIGAGDQDQVSVYIASFILLIVVLYLVIMPLGIWMINPLFHLMGVSDEIMPSVDAFMHVWFLGFMFMMLGFVGSNLLRAHGQAKRSAQLQIAGCLLNALLSPLFIFICHWGIRGSAIAGVIARIIMVSSLYHNLFKSYMPNPMASFQHAWSCFSQYSKNILSIAVPAILTNIMGPLSAIWLVHLLAHFGDATVAGFGIASRIEMMAVVPLFALSASVVPVIGQNLGAKFYQRSYDALVNSYCISLCWGLLMTVVLFFSGAYISGLFSNNSNIIQVASLYLMILPCSYASWGLLMMTNACFNSMGLPLYSTALTVVRMLVLFIPLSYIFSTYWHAEGVFVAYALSNFLASGIAWVVGVSQFKSRYVYA